MRGVYTSVNDIRKHVFAEVAKLSYDYKVMFPCMRPLLRQ